MSALPGVFALLGVIAIAWAQANDHNNQQNTIDDQKSKQTNICTSVCHTYFIFYALIEKSIVQSRFSFHERTLL